MGRSDFFMTSLGRVVVPSPKIAIKLPRTFEKLHCKGESNRFRGKRDPSVQTDKDLLHLYQDKTRMTTSISSEALKYKIRREK